MPWVLAATAPTQLLAELWAGLLDLEEIPTRVVPSDTSMFGGVMSLPCRLMVPDDRLSDAQALLVDAAEQAPDGDDA